MSGDPERSVVVAVGTNTGNQALDWAAAEASARHCPLHVVHVQRLQWAVDPSGLVPVADFSPNRVAAEQVLRDAVNRAHSVAPDINVAADLLFGPTVRRLVAHARGAQLLVLGSREAPFPRRLRAHLRHSVCGAVTCRALCPVAIVRPLRSGPYAAASPRVVVGVDERGDSAAALVVAFRAAAQRGVPVTAVHAWKRDVPADHEAVCGPPAAAEARASLLLDQALEPGRSRFADVSVERRLLAAEPAAALIRESEGAALIVVGSRSQGAARTTPFGSVSRSVARRARCPVVVVRTAGPTAAEQAHPARRTAVSLMDPARAKPARRRRTPWE